jgi:hypothetical protein
MGKHLLKYLVILIIIYGLLVGGYYGFRKDIEGQKDKIIVLIEAGYNVSEDWARNVYRKIENLEEKYIVEAYYFNTLIEKVPNVDNDYEYEDFYRISPYGDADYGLIEQFKDNLRKQNRRLDYLIGSHKLDKHAGGTKVIYMN